MLPGTFHRSRGRKGRSYAALVFMAGLWLWPCSGLRANLSIQPMLVRHQAQADKATEIVLQLTNPSRTKTLPVTTVP